MPEEKNPSWIEFQSTLPRRERPFFCFSTDQTHSFNPRSREGSDEEEACLTFCINMFQSTLPRRERRLHNRTGSISLSVSIHAPAKGATYAGGRWWPAVKFQSTLPRRERQQYHQMAYRCYVFQSTLPRRERRRWMHRKGTSIKVSIHAPAKGATLYVYRDA